MFLESLCFLQRERINFEAGKPKSKRFEVRCVYEKMRSFLSNFSRHVFENPAKLLLLIIDIIIFTNYHKCYNYSYNKL